MDTGGAETNPDDTNPDDSGLEDNGVFSAYLNRKVMGGWLAATCVMTALEAFALIAGVGSGIDWFLLISFAGVSGVIALHVFDRRPVLIVNQQGIHDRRISREMIPWTDVLWHNIEARPALPFVGVGLTDETAKKVGVHPWSIVFKNQRGPFGKLKGYRIWPHRTLGERDDFVRAVQRFAPSQHDG